MNTNVHRAATLWSQLKTIAPLAISTIALALSLISLFLSQLEPAKIQVHPSEFAYVEAGKDNLLAIHLYLTFSNKGARFGVVHKVALLLEPPGKSDAYLLQAAYFDRLDAKGSFASESVVGPIPVDGHHTVSRQVRFLSARDKPGDYRALLVQGEYQATILVWTSPDGPPATTAPFPFVLSERDLEELDRQRAGKQRATTELHQRQFQRWGARAMNGQQVEILLTGKQ